MKIGNQTIKLENTPKILQTSSMVGPKEKQGPLSIYFDLDTQDIFLGEKSFEKAESKMMETCINNLLNTIPKIKPPTIDVAANSPVSIKRTLAICFFSIPRIL